MGINKIFLMTIINVILKFIQDENISIKGHTHYKPYILLNSADD